MRVIGTLIPFIGVTQSPGRAQYWSWKFGAKTLPSSRKADPSGHELGQVRRLYFGQDQIGVYARLDGAMGGVGGSTRASAASITSRSPSSAAASAVAASMIARARRP